jgi:hypothetical protein
VVAAVVWTAFYFTGMDVLAEQRPFIEVLEQW